MLNKVILVLNALILMVNFAVAFTSSEQQYDILNAAVRMPSVRYVGRSGPGPETDLAYYRLVQSLERFASKEQIAAFSREQMEAIYAGLDHYSFVVRTGVESALQRGLEGVERREEYEGIGRRARSGVEEILSGRFADPALVARLTTEIIRQAG